MAIIDVLKDRAIDRLEKNKEFMSETKLKLYTAIISECNDIDTLRDIVDNELELDLQRYLFEANEREKFEPHNLGEIEEVLSKKYNKTKISIIHNNMAMVQDIDDDALLELTCKIYMQQQEEGVSIDELDSLEFEEGEDDNYASESDDEEGVGIDDIDSLEFEEGEEFEEDEGVGIDDIDSLEFEEGEDDNYESEDTFDVDNVEFEEEQEEYFEDSIDEDETSEEQTDDDAIIDFGMSEEEFKSIEKSKEIEDGVSLDNLDELDGLFDEEYDQSEDNGLYDEDDVFIEEDEEEPEKDNFEDSEDIFEDEADRILAGIDIEEEFDDTEEEPEDSDMFSSIDNMDTEDMFEDSDPDEEDGQFDSIDSIDTDDMFIDDGFEELEEDEQSDVTEDIDDIDTDDMFVDEGIDESVDELSDELDSVDSIDTDDMFEDETEGEVEDDPMASIDNIDADDMFSDEEDDSIEEDDSSRNAFFDRQTNNQNSSHANNQPNRVNKNEIFNNGTDRGKKTQDTFNTLSNIFNGTGKMFKKAGSKLHELGKSDFFKP